ncbi:MAG: RDD family protein [Bacilli bacterium]|nr:RDD family protein [Bacilli bacterium]
MENPSISQNKKEEVEYLKAPFGKRLVMIVLEVFFLLFGTLGFLFVSRLIVEASPAYNDAFDTYIRISKESGLYVCDDSTDNNLVTLPEYYADKTFEEQNLLIDDALVNFYSNPNYFSQDSTNEGYGPDVYSADKYGSFSIEKESGIKFFLLDSDDKPVRNPSLTEEQMNKFYLSAYDRGVNRIENAPGYIEARNLLTIYINLILIPVSITLSFLVFEFVIPLISGRRGWQNIGMRIMNISLLSPNALSPKFTVFLRRQLFQLFLEILLSLVSFGIPLIISFSMMAVRKDGLCLHDYLALTYMVDSSEKSVYVSYEEMNRLAAKASQTESEHFLDAGNRKAALNENSIWNDLREKSDK